MNIDNLKTEVSKIKWLHRIDLGNGIITPGVDESPAKLKKLGLPEDLHGKTVLDIGAWDGFFSFEAQRRGAKQVLATDYFCWGGVGFRIVKMYSFFFSFPHRIGIAISHKIKNKQPFFPTLQQNRVVFYAWR